MPMKQLGIIIFIKDYDEDWQVPAEFIDKLSSSYANSILIDPHYSFIESLGLLLHTAEQSAPDLLKKQITCP